MKQKLRELIRKSGYDLVSFDPRFSFEARKLHLINQFRINHILDVGANIGQSGLAMRSRGYKGKITSFEPMIDAYTALKQTASPDSEWTVVRAGLGSQNEKAFINISKNSFSSSVKQILPRHLEVYPDSAFIAQETIDIFTLDSIFNNCVQPDSKVVLKIDTQGYESEVLEGARESLPKIDIVILEMSLEPIYEGQELLPAMLTKMQALGYKPAILEPCDVDYKQYTIMVMDGWFIRI